MGPPDPPTRRDREPRDPDRGFGQRDPSQRRRPGRPGPIEPLFGIAQVELPGTLGPEDGRYLDSAGESDRITILETVGALPPPRRRRRQPKQLAGEASKARVPVTIVSVVLAGEPFRSEVEATSWLQKVGIEPDETFRDLFATLDRLLAAESAAVGRPYTRRWDEDDALAARFGYGDGTETADARMRAGLAIDVRGGTEAPRRERIERSMPLRRIAAVLRGREPLRTCELLVPRVSSDLAAGRTVAAAAGIEAAVSTTVEEMAGLADDDEHLADIANLRELLPELTEVSRQVAAGAKAWPGLAGSLAEPVAIAEQVLRRIRALDP